MSFSFEPLALPGVVLVRMRSIADARGAFVEVYKRSEFVAAGITDDFVQDNSSISNRGVLRGLHFQTAPKAQAKLVRVVSGEVYDVVVDIRTESPSFGRWLGVTLTAAEPALLYVPAGFAHGFCTLSEVAEVAYKTSNEYAPECEGGLCWNDHALAISWPVETPILSPRDQTWPAFDDLKLHART